MKRLIKSKLAVVTAGVLALGAVGGGVAIASGIGDDSGPDRAITGPALAGAEAAALAHTGGGLVTDTEVGDEESVYEVEVTLANGDEVDVQLNRSFDVVGSETDGPDED